MAFSDLNNHFQSVPLADRKDGRRQFQFFGIDFKSSEEVWISSNKF